MLIKLQKELEEENFSRYVQKNPEEVKKVIQGRINILKESISETPFDNHIGKLKEGIDKLEEKLQKEIDEIKDLANAIETGMAKLTPKGIRKPKKGEEE